MGEFRKPFDRVEYDRSDKPARNAIINYYYNRYNIKPIDAPDKYGPDLQIPNRKIFLEVEIKYNWKGYNEKFPFNTVHVLKRKKKYLKYGKILFYILSSNLKYAIAFKDEYIQDKYLVEVPNKRVASGEYFLIFLKSCVHK